MTGREYSLTLSRARINPGDAIIQFVNSGEDAHDLVVKRFGGTRAFRRRRDPARETSRSSTPAWGGASTTCSTAPLADHKALGMKAFLTVRRHRR